MDENNNPINTITTQLRNLPQDIQNAYRSESTTDKLYDIAERAGLSEDQENGLENETALVMLGFEPPSNFVANLQKTLGVPEEKARAVAQDINEQIFRPIRDSLKLINGLPADGSPSEVKGAAAVVPGGGENKHLVETYPSEKRNGFGTINGGGARSFDPPPLPARPSRPAPPPALGAPLNTPARETLPPKLLPTPPAPPSPQHEKAPAPEPAAKTIVRPWGEYPASVPPLERKEQKPAPARNDKTAPAADEVIDREKLLAEIENPTPFTRIPTDLVAKKLGGIVTLPREEKDAHVNEPAAPPPPRTPAPPLNPAADPYREPPTA